MPELLPLESGAIDEHRDLIEHATRRVHIAVITAHPTGAWVTCNVSPLPGSDEGTIDDASIRIWLRAPVTRPHSHSR